MIKTAEFVSPKHPDKICDFIADSILDEYLKHDPFSRVAVEVMGGHGAITVSGEVTSSANGNVNIEKIIKGIVGPDYSVKIHLVPQSREIGQGVDIGGAGDQGIMVGYACNETENLMPLEYELARNLCQEIYKKYPYDGKVQVTVDGKKVKTVVASFQNSNSPELLELVKSKIQAEEYLINPAGEWHVGGFDADSGLSGRKIVIDAYGPNVPVGGGSFSGKDFTKVDRSGAYMARKIAVDQLKKNNAKEVWVKLAYAIGKKDPVMATVIIDGQNVSFPEYDLTPAGIRQALQLENVVYKDTCTWGHFGRGFPWDK
jgi:S-adenosylmethionine synthetase